MKNKYKLFSASYILKFKSTSRDFFFCEKQNKKIKEENGKCNISTHKT